ncbi:metal-sensitive transcriptional regulator [Pedobacter nutrimenti]|uniref:Uncharacterized protein n=1 Tax=Pedobacter nutrimenti TaxID=1241337 RepID=A0A318UEY0_9SPHI|nr:hypothetical protein [Pedobacter nutrimenti]PYF74653.1 hypothetical protein B0O44_10398 [Pedobacter nutrimenti]
MLPRELTGDLIKRLNSVKGQIEGIVNIQFKAADKALQKAHL